MSAAGSAPSDDGKAGAGVPRAGLLTSPRPESLDPAGGYRALSVGLDLGPTPGTGGKLAVGKFLVASKRLEDPNFARTVVLLLHYDARGAIGLVINHPTKMTLAKILPEVEGVQDRADAVYVGGPVALDQVMLLIRSPRPPSGTSPVFDDVATSSSLSTLRQLTGPGTKAAFRAYLGHAGWAPGQLEAEVARGGWHVAPGEAKAIFDQPSSQVWPDLIDRISGSWASAGSAPLVP